MDHRIWGGIPFGYHQTNIILHAVTTLLLYFVILQIFRSRLAAFLGSFIFAIQPLQVSTVAWIGGRTDSLCTLWVTLFLLTLVKAARTAGKDRNIWSVLALLLYFITILTKEQMIGILPLIPFAYRTFQDHRTNASNSPASGRYLWGIAITYTFVSLIFVAMWLQLGPPRPSFMHNHIASILSEGFDTVLYFVILLFAPTPASIHTLCLDNIRQSGWLSLIGGVLVIGIVGRLFFINIKRNPAVSWFIGFMCLTIFPVSNFVPLPSLLVAPYRAGVTGLASAALMGVLLSAWLMKIGFTSTDSVKRKPFKALPAAAIGAYLLYLLVLTGWGVTKWHDELSIYSTIAHYDPGSIINRINLSSAYLCRGEYEPAIDNLEAILTRIYGSDRWKVGDYAIIALKTDPSITQTIADNQGNKVAPTKWLNALLTQIGSAYLTIKQDKKGFAFLVMANKINPGDQYTLLGLADYYLIKGDVSHAEQEAIKAMIIQPKCVDTHAKLGVIYEKERKWGKARNEFAYCAANQPWEGEANVKLANALDHLGKRNQAISLLRSLLQRNPGRSDAIKLLARIQTNINAGN
jgi:tetratricopeptide (TPR) repeat protein